MTSSAFMNGPRDLLAKCSTPINTINLPFKKENEPLSQTSIIKSACNTKDNNERNVPLLGVPSGIQKTTSFKLSKPNEKPINNSYPKTSESKKIKKTTPMKQVEQQAMQNTHKKPIKKANSEAENKVSMKQMQVLTAPNANPYFLSNGTTSSLPKHTINHTKGAESTRAHTIKLVTIPLAVSHAPKTSSTQITPSSRFENKLSDKISNTFRPINKEPLFSQSQKELNLHYLK